MNHYQFSLLDMKEMETILFQHGTPLAVRHVDDYMLEIYQLYHYYVEFIYYANGKGNMAVRCFISPDELKPYLETIDISSITSSEGIDG